MSLCWAPLPPEMHILTVVILLQGMGVVWPASTSPPLGMTVHVVPLDSSQGQTVRAYFTAIVSGECAEVSGLCADGEDCIVETNTIPFTGTKPGGDWCSHHWQKTLAADFSGTLKLGSSSEMFLALKADPVTRYSGLNRPAFVALPPPLRVNEKCPHHFPLSIKDLDGDRVRCRFAQADQGECEDCQPLSFVELDQAACTLTFTGDASPGLYHMYLMAEDIVPAPQSALSAHNTPMSAVPFILSLTVETTVKSCSAEPVVTADNQAEHSVLRILPFNQQSFTANFESNQESVLEIAVIGPPQLYRTDFVTMGPIASLSIAWVRTDNKLGRLLPVCYVANTLTLQSEPHCVWLYQVEMTTLPKGTVLTCGSTKMDLVLPISSFTNINMAELQLNSPDCPISYNDTYLTAQILLQGCGTKAVHSGDELIFTNTLKTADNPTQVIRRKPILVLPLACRIPSVQVKGPAYQISMPVEEEVFGVVEFKLEFYLPGNGPLAEFTRSPVFRYDNRRFRREIRTDETTSSGGVNSTVDTSTAAVTGKIGSKIDVLDLLVTSNCSVLRAEMIVNSCYKSETSDFSMSSPLLDGGCTASASTIEVITTSTGSKVYRLYLGSLNLQGSTMYVRCTVNLCITTQPSQTCPDLCTTKMTRADMVKNVFSKSYIITSDAVSLVYTTPAPTTTRTTAKTTVKTTVAATTTTPVATTTTPAVTTATTTSSTSNTTSDAAEWAPSKAVGVMMALACVILHPFLY